MQFVVQKGEGVFQWFDVDDDDCMKLPVHFSPFSSTEEYASGEEYSQEEWKYAKKIPVPTFRCFFDKGDDDIDDSEDDSGGEENGYKTQVENYVEEDSKPRAVPKSGVVGAREIIDLTIDEDDKEEEKEEIDERLIEQIDATWMECDDLEKIMTQQDVENFFSKLDVDDSDDDDDDEEMAEKNKNGTEESDLDSVTVWEPIFLKKE